jgi:VIT1/CCC1 family predicted Fe2+/Mn2+ transporter
MSEPKLPSSRRVLDPHERVAEVLFGLIMVLTFTGSINAAQAGQAEIRTMLYGALGCNVAWGIIDAVLYLMGSLAERSQSLIALRGLRRATDDAQAHRIIADALPPLVASVMEPAQFEAIRQRLNRLPEPPEVARLNKMDYLGGLGVFLLVFLSTFPVVIPFLFIQDAVMALRVSNGIAIGLMFFTGCAYGRCTGRRPWLTGIVMIFVGVVLVAISKALGG